MEKDNLNRRNFLKTSLKTIAVGSLALSTLDIKKLLASGSDVNDVTSVMKVINLADYPDLASVGGSVVIGRALVRRVSQSKFVAISMICTHKKCDIDYTGDGFECPCHGSAFDSNGKVINGPATRNLRTYKTTFNEGENTLTINM